MTHDRLLFSVLDWIHERMWRAGIRFQWPSWLLDWAWDKQATPYVPPREHRSYVTPDDQRDGTS